jgi:hypothetical protein
MKGESATLDGPSDLCHRASQIYASDKWTAKPKRREKRIRSITAWARVVHSRKGTAVKLIRPRIRLSDLPSLTAGKGRQRAMVIVHDLILRMGEHNRSDKRGIRVGGRIRGIWEGMAQRSSNEIGSA